MLKWLKRILGIAQPEVNEAQVDVTVPPPRAARRQTGLIQELIDRRAARKLVATDESD